MPIDPRVEILSEADIDELAQKARRKAELDEEDFWAEFMDRGKDRPSIVR